MSLTLIWTTATTGGNSVVAMLYGDPDVYVPIYSRNQTQNSSSSMGFITATTTLRKYRAVSVDVQTNQLFVFDGGKPSVLSFADAINSNQNLVFSTTISSAFPVSTQVNFYFRYIFNRKK